ncbi:phage terminase small subunit [Pasteurella multocida subsp. multocida]|uniref:Phage terminase small subunit n=1 Tax=Pasteurella multocida TaxID=747 RepID=A0A9X3ZMJ6_PASMD|nr:phage terminase small subunit [Pasteurella multocida]MBF6981694.1 terminase [Pasteurella multocida]MDA5611884.1 phage terminase small subunit [Pasteurella multocida]MDA5614351.1 phage terminase small subunit [Pasteurella multocida]MDA5619393.1 phage terminase small subunit [Pasteurella multocida subsp. multocida]MDA5621907.1 phage terminase small subunit [Pasteurella multocida subsp. multocida]
MARLSPAQIHVMHVAAQQASAADDEQLENYDEYEKMMFLLARHQKNLKEIQSTELKAEYKRSILQEFMPWIEGVLKTGNGKQDNVLMTWLVWAIDCAEYHLALQIADYALHQQLVLPEPFTRTLGTLLAEEFADAAKIARTANKPFELAYLTRVEELVRDEDMPDQSRARLMREIGTLQVESNKAQALVALERALELDLNVGVKGLVEKLRKELEKQSNEDTN